MNLTYTNIVLKVGGQILLLVIGIMAITFGIESDWPSKNVDKMFSTTPVVTGVNTKTVTPVTNAIKATAVAVAVASAKMKAKPEIKSKVKPEAKPEAKPEVTKVEAKPEAIKTKANPKVETAVKAKTTAVAVAAFKKLLEKRKVAAAAK
jgi:hypothetical protein